MRLHPHIEVEEIPVPDSLNLVVKMVNAGRGNSWVVGFLESLGLPLPSDLRQRILSGSSTQTDGITLMNLAQPIL